MPVSRTGGIWAKPLEGCCKVTMDWFLVSRRPNAARSIIQRYSECLLIIGNKLPGRWSSKNTVAVCWGQLHCDWVVQKIEIHIVTIHTYALSLSENSHKTKHIASCDFGIVTQTKLVPVDTACSGFMTSSARYGPWWRSGAVPTFHDFGKKTRTAVPSWVTSCHFMSNWVVPKWVGFHQKVWTGMVSKRCAAMNLK
jgi:hypothetical protein